MLEYPLGEAPTGASYSAYDEAMHVAMGETDWDDEEPGPGEARCVNCGFIVPTKKIETVDDLYLGQCTECVAGE